MHWHIMQPSLVQGGWGNGYTTKKVAHYKKGDALQKTGAHNPQTGTRNPKQEPA